MTTDLERYALPDGGESSLNESIEALVSDLERVTEERDEALDEAKAADLHRNLNRRVADALGLLDERVDAETGESYLPSWHDMPEQVTALRRQRDEARRERDEMAAFGCAVVEATDEMREQWAEIEARREAEKMALSAALETAMAEIVRADSTIIEALQVLSVEAQIAGDAEMVALCERTLRPGIEALEACCAAICETIAAATIPD